MCFIEYNWTADCWQFRIGDKFTDFQGVRSLPTLNEWREYLATKHCCITKTSSRTYEVKCSLVQEA